MKKKNSPFQEFENAFFSSAMALVFQFAQKEYLVLDFTTAFLQSEVYRDFFSNHTIFSQSPKYVLQLFREELDKKNKLLVHGNNTLGDSDVAYWLGYLFADWTQTFACDVSKIPQKHLQWMYDNYEMLHTQSTRYVYQLYTDDIANEI